MTVRMPRIGRIPPNAPAIFRERFLKYDLPRVLGLFKEEFISTLKAIKFIYDLEPSYYRVSTREVIIRLPDMKTYMWEPDYHYNHTLLSLIHEIGHHVKIMIITLPIYQAIPIYKAIKDYVVALFGPTPARIAAIGEEVDYYTNEVIASIIEVRGGRRLGIPNSTILRAIANVFGLEVADIVFRVDRKFGDELEKIVFK